MKGDVSRMEIVYRVGNSLYINLTNKCSCACTFCLRQTTDKVGESDSLWLEREPSAQEVIKALEEADLSGRDEIVFCGFGEPTCALPVLLESAAWVRNHTSLPVRINTNGQGSLIAGRDIAGDLAVDGHVGIVDILREHFDVPLHSGTFAPTDDSTRLRLFDSDTRRHGAVDNFVDC